MAKTTKTSSRTSTKDKVTHVFKQAKESLKVLETLEREAVAKARTYVKLPKVMLPNAAERKRLTNDRILSSLRKLGVATQAEVDSLRAQIEKLENDLAALRRGRASLAAASTETNAVPTV